MQGGDERLPRRTSILADLPPRKQPLGAHLHQNLARRLGKALIMIRGLTVAVLCGALWAQVPPAPSQQTPAAQAPSTQPPAAVPDTNQGPLPEAKPDPGSGPQEQDATGALDAAELLPPVPRTACW